MPHVPTDRWRRIEELYHAAVARPSSQRSAFVAEACAGDDGLRRDVESLLAHEPESEHFLEAPALDVAAQVMADEQNTFSAGQRVGSYTIRSPIGAGGMGEVYRAHDSKLGRDVAIKILPPTLTIDPDRRARFEREARTLAALNHPHIGAIYGLEELGGTPALVLELVDGETLAERIGRGPLALAEAVEAAAQIAEALEAAHERGIVHRDLKPANVKLTPGGIVKVLDFGLAKFVNPVGADVPHSSITVDATHEGTLLGTAGYLSPEQARGQATDKRTDIWAFGCVLYEMLAGLRAFAGDTAADTIPAILDGDVDWQALPERTPAGIRRLLRRCLAKDARHRLRDIGDARLELLDGRDEDPVGAGRPGSGRPNMPFLALAFVVVAAASAALGAFFRPDVHNKRTEPSVRFSISPPPGAVFADAPDNTFLALSPDGSQLAVVTTEPAGTTRVWVRPLSSFDATPVTGTEEAASVFWSPDGQSLGFFADHKLKRVDLSGKAPITVCDVPQAEGITGTWGSDGRILFAPVTGTTVFSVPAGGGTPSAAIAVDEAKEGVVQWPSFLSDGRRFVYVVRPPDRSHRTLMLAEPGKTPRPILAVDSNVEWVDPDYFVFARKDGTLVAQRFDLSRGQIVGEPVSIASSVDYGLGPGRAMFAVSRSGTVAYLPEQVSQMMWTDRMGKALELVGPSGSYTGLRLSPDGGRVLFGRMQSGTGTADLFVSDLRRRTEDRLTSDPGNEVGGVWLHGGRAIAFAADRGGPPHLFRKDIATGTEDELLPAGKRQLPTDVSPDGTTLVFVERTARASGRLWTMALPSHARSALIGTTFDESDAHFSPDGLFIAYTSDESGSGRYDVYIAAFPHGPRLRVSTAEGGRAPRWARDGRELFYLTSDRRLVTVPVRTRPSLELGSGRTLFTTGATTWSDYDVSMDGKRFIAIVLPEAAPVAVVQHFVSDLQR